MYLSLLVILSIRCPKAELHYQIPTKGSGPSSMFETTATKARSRIDDLDGVVAITRNPAKDGVDGRKRLRMSLNEQSVELNWRREQ